MKKAFFAVLLLTGAAAILSSLSYAGPAVDDEAVMRVPTRSTSMLRTETGARNRALGTSATLAFDTTFVGYSGTNHFNATNNWWNIYAGTLRPGTGNVLNASWDFENLTFQGNSGDSLQGWWPTWHRAGAIGANDASWVFSCLDYGNTANYKIPGSNTRTVGVIGVWHADPGVLNAGTNGAHRVFWTPMSGSQSAWCGLRAVDDNSVKDPITNNPFNGTVYNYHDAGLGQKFPGYARQWDQMLYHDITPVSGQDLEISFLYRTHMSLGYSDPGNFPAKAAGRRGWFHGDPISTAAGNFISAYNAAIVDSFQVFIGVPVNDAAVKLSNGATHPVYDLQRRWFSEVIQAFDGAAPYYELVQKAGMNPVITDTTGYNTFTQSVAWTPYISSIATSVKNPTGKIRLVFRNKTNNNGDDYSSAFTSLGGRGAVMIDDVKIKWSGDVSATTIGDFEGDATNPKNINNDTGVGPDVTWKSTGKPPALYFHATTWAPGLPWNDLCSTAPGGPTATCNLVGNVLDASNFDSGHSIGDPSYPAGKQQFEGALSPTINLKLEPADLPTLGDPVGTLPNPMGLTATNSAASDDYYITYDVNAADFNYAKTGVLYQYQIMSWPTLNAWGDKVWGVLQSGGSVFYNPDPQCYRDYMAYKANGQIVTSNATGVPDSVRLLLNLQNWPSAYAPAASGTNPTDGCYFDNISFVIVNKVGGGSDLGTISSEIWQWFNDAFPINGVDDIAIALGSGTSVSALDTCGAMVKGALNRAQSSSNAGLGGLRLAVLADSIKVSAPDMTLGVGDTATTDVRVDMVFRILPGPGNYQSAAEGGVAPIYSQVTGLAGGLKLLKRPDQRTGVGVVIDPTNVADKSFWSEYIRTPGEFSSPSAHPGNQWSNLTWNSVRIDTLETNAFPGLQVSSTGDFQSTIHELDPHYTDLGISRKKCFIVDTLGTFNSNNMVCDGTTPPWMAAVPTSRSGWDGTFDTIEGTKVIPDGLLTPGSHVQYFFRKSQVFGYLGYKMDPDTTYIRYQKSEDNYDGHRWQQFSVLPDRWKDTEFGGAGMACVLFADYNDRRGAELVWTSVMDSIGGTAADRWGSFNGWHSAGGVDLNKDTNPTLQAQAFVYKNAQPGTLWDKYDVRATESGSSVGVRLGGRDVLPGSGLLYGHDAQVAPTKAMLTQFYKGVALLSGDANTQILGPVAPEMPEKDTEILADFLTSTTGLVAQPRSLFIAGHGFVEAEVANHSAFLTDPLGVKLIDKDYRKYSGSLAYCTDLTSTSLITDKLVFGVGVTCFYTNDVIDYVPEKANAALAGWYQSQPAHPGVVYGAEVMHTNDTGLTSENYISLVDGFDLWNLWANACGPLGSKARNSYMTIMMSKVFGGTCSGFANPGSALDVPQVGNGGQFANFMKIGNSAQRSGKATVNFGVATTGRVRVRLYDVTGRLVRTLADRTFPGGQAQSVTWDGRDDGGNQAARGVYFARINFASGAAINGRVVVLQ